MTAKDLSIVVRGVAPIIREYVASSLLSFADGIKDLSRRVDRAAEVQVQLKSELDAVRSEIGHVEARKGERGSSVTTGKGSPTSEGLIGDVYIDATTGDIYQWR